MVYPKIIFMLTSLLLANYCTSPRTLLDYFTITFVINHYPGEPMSDFNTQVIPELPSVASRIKKEHLSRKHHLAPLLKHTSPLLITKYTWNLPNAVEILPQPNLCFHVDLPHYPSTLCHNLRCFSIPQL